MGTGATLTGAVCSRLLAAGEVGEVFAERRIGIDPERGGERAPDAGRRIVEREHDHLVTRVARTFEAVDAFHHDVGHGARRTLGIAAQLAVHQLVVGVVALAAQQVERLGHRVGCGCHVTSLPSAARLASHDD